jgi:uncharacterized membrane protein
MAAIVSSVTINRSQGDVWAYMDDLERHHEWQGQIQSTEVLTDGPVGVGTRAAEMRKMPLGPAQKMTYEITAYDAPRTITFQFVDGPVRPIGTVTAEAIGDAQTRVTVELNVVGHGIGRLLAPLVRRSAAKDVPADQQRLKERLEGAR